MNTRAKWERIVRGLALAGTVTLVAGCSGPTEPDAATETSVRELEGSHAANDLDPLTAQRWIDHVEVGRGLDARGAITPAQRGDRFEDDEAIYVSMEVTDAPAGSRVLLSVLDGESGQTVWTSERTVDAGLSHLAFKIDDSDLGLGRYTASVIVGDESVAERTFVIG